MSWSRFPPFLSSSKNSEKLIQIAHGYPSTWPRACTCLLCSGTSKTLWGKIRFHHAHNVQDRMKLAWAQGPIPLETTFLLCRGAQNTTRSNGRQLIESPANWRGRLRGDREMKQQIRNKRSASGAVCSSFQLGQDWMGVWNANTTSTGNGGRFHETDPYVSDFRILDIERVWA